MPTSVLTDIVEELAKVRRTLAIVQADLDAIKRDLQEFRHMGLRPPGQHKPTGGSDSDAVGTETRGDQ
jgi:hypothetical protein